MLEVPSALPRRSARTCFDPFTLFRVSFTRPVVVVIIRILEVTTFLPFPARIDENSATRARSAPDVDKPAETENEKSNPRLERTQTR